MVLGKHLLRVDGACRLIVDEGVKAPFTEGSIMAQESNGGLGLTFRAVHRER